MRDDVGDVLQYKLGSFLAFLQFLEQQTRLQIPECTTRNMDHKNSETLNRSPKYLQVRIGSFVFTCAASGRQAWTSACSLAHKAPWANREHCGTAPVYLLLHFLSNTKTIQTLVQSNEVRSLWILQSSHTHPGCHPKSSCTQTCWEKRRWWWAPPVWRMFVLRILRYHPEF